MEKREWHLYMLQQLCGLRSSVPFSHIFCSPPRSCVCVFKWKSFVKFILEFKLFAFFWYVIHFIRTQRSGLKFYRVKRSKTLLSPFIGLLHFSVPIGIFLFSVFYKEDKVLYGCQWKCKSYLSSCRQCYRPPIHFPT